MTIIKQALIISIPYSAIVSFASYIVTLNWVAVIEDGAQTKTLKGWQAVQYLISQEGLLSYLLALLPQYLFLVVVIFVALVIQGVCFARSSAA